MESWRNITVTCQEAASELSNSLPMINTENFSLNDSMSAVELMDPKMDQCYGVEGSISVEDLVIPKIPNDFNDEALIQLFQCMIVNETAFLDGASYHESTHQCVFAWEDSLKNLNQVDDKRIFILSAFAKSMQCCIQHSMKCILNADVFEDEDFQPTSSISSSMSENGNDMEVIENLQLAMTYCEDLMGPLGDELKMLLQFRYELHKLLSSCKELVTQCIKRANASRFSTSASSSESKSTCLRLLAESKDSSIHALRSLQGIQEYIESRKISIVNTESNGMNGNDEFKSVLAVDITSHTEYSQLEFAYNGMIAKLNQTGPVRHIDFKSFHKSVSHLIWICSSIRDCCDFCDNNLAGSNRSTVNFEHLLHYTLSCADKKLHLLARSVFSGTLYLVLEEMPSLVLRSWGSRGIPSPYFNCTDRALAMTEQYIESVSGACWDTLRALCSHRNRIMVKLEAPLSAWGNLIHEGNIIDRMFRDINQIADEKQQWCMLWSSMVCTTLMDLSIGLMIEYDLLSIEEMGYIFWYWEYIYSSKLIALERLRTMRFEVENIMYSALLDAEMTSRKDDLRKKASSKGKKIKQIEKLINDPSIRTDAIDALFKRQIFEPLSIQYTCEELYVRGRGQLCRGVFRMVVAFSQLGLIREFDSAFTTQKIKFDQRFRSFAGIPYPSLLPFSEYLRTINNGKPLPDSSETAGLVLANSVPPVDIQILVSTSLQCFQQGKKIFEALRKIPINSFMDTVCHESAISLMKVAVGNSVSTVRITQLLEEKFGKESGDDKTHSHSLEGLAIASLDMSHHKHFPITILKPC